MAPYTPEDVRFLFARATEQRALAGQLHEWSRRLRAVRRSRAGPHPPPAHGEPPVDGRTPALGPGRGR